MRLGKVMPRSRMSRLIATIIVPPDDRAYRTTRKASTSTRVELAAERFVPVTTIRRRWVSVDFHDLDHTTMPVLRLDA